MKKLFIDIETYSSVDIKECGAYKYMESPDFEILIVGYAVDDKPVKIIDLTKTKKLPEDFITLLTNPKVLKVAHNAVFERLAFKRIGYDVPPYQWYCTSVKAGYCGLPMSLKDVSKALNLQEGKLDTGLALIKYFSCPVKPSKANDFRERNYPEHAPEKWEEYKEYNKYDVLAEREIYNRLEKYEIPESEREMYFLDQEINDRGMLVDVDLAKSAVFITEEYERIKLERLYELTKLPNPKSQLQFKTWLNNSLKWSILRLDKEAIKDVRKRMELRNVAPEYLEALDLYSTLSKTSIKKFPKMLDWAMKDNRARGLFQFYGASRTGRWAGRGIQLQNLSKNHDSDMTTQRELVRSRDWESVEMIYGDVFDMLSQLVRTALIAPKGKLLSVADYAAIEARVISWLSGEQWRLDVFKGDGKIYEATGSRMFGVPIEKITKGSDLRAKSKISELALGYAGGVGALNAMGADKMGLSEDVCRDLVRKWRDANPKICKMWKDIETAAIEAVYTGKRKILFDYKSLEFEYDGDCLMIRLPSGRSLFYREPELEESKWGGTAITYMGMNQTTKKWERIDTHGGKLTENVVQAIARDLLGFSMAQLSKNGYKPVCHVHDEVLVEVSERRAKACYDEMVEIMSRTPKWASDLPLRADGYITPFYIKD